MNKRYYVLDAIRGLALINMIGYHTLFDIVAIFNYQINFFYSKYAYFWQQCICCTFILLSGFCYSFSKNKLKRGLIVFILGALISLVTLFFIPDNIILFGVLTLIGSCMLILIPFNKLFSNINPNVGFVISLLLFVITRNINNGYLNLVFWDLYKMPNYLYCNLFSSYLGFPSAKFYSSDYFSLLPWIFLFINGYFIYRIFKKYNMLYVFEPHICKILEFIGKHSLLIYVVHQPIIYLLCYVIFNLNII